MFGNNATREIKGHGMITNGRIVSELFVGTWLKVSFDDAGSKILEKKSKTVLLKSKRKREMYPMNLKPITGKSSLFLLTKASLHDIAPKALPSKFQGYKETHTG